MPLDPSLAGRTFPPTAPYAATEERIAAFAAATGSVRTAGGPAPATFPIVVAFEAMTGLMQHPGVGIELHRVVHGAQTFLHQRAIEPGDLLSAELTVTSLRHVGGADIIATSSAITDTHGSLVCTAQATLVHQADHG